MSRLPGDVNLGLLITLTHKTSWVCRRKKGTGKGLYKNC